MFAFFQFDTSLEKIFGFSALIGTGLFVIRLGMQLMGADHGADTDVHGDVTSAHEGHSEFGFRLLTVQGFTAFFMMFGWVGLALLKNSKVSEGWSLLGAAISGLGAVWVIAWIMTSMRKLQSSGNIRMENAVGRQGTVYLKIPAEGQGVVQISIQDRMREMDAVSENKEEITTGTQVEVVRVTGANLLVVKKV